MPVHSPETNAFLEIPRATEEATGKPVADQLAAFAGSAITGRGRTWATWSGTDPLDWRSLLERRTPSVLAPERETTRVLGAELPRRRSAPGCRAAATATGGSPTTRLRATSSPSTR